MTGLLGYGGAYKAINDADLVLLLGTDFPFSEFLPGNKVKKVQVDVRPKHIGRRTNVDVGLVDGDVKETVKALLSSVKPKNEDKFLKKHLDETADFHELLQHYVEKGPGIMPIRPEFLAATLSRGSPTRCSSSILAPHASGHHAILGAAGTGESLARLHGHRWPTPRPMLSRSACFSGRQTIALSGDGGFTMLALGDLLTQVERRTSVVQNHPGLDVRGSCRYLTPTS